MSNKLLIAYFEMLNSEQGTKEAPKMIYYSTTRGEIYILHQSYSTSRYFKVSVVTGGMEGHKTEVYLLNIPYTSMPNTIAIFTDFMEKHINLKPYDDLLYNI